MRIGIVSDIHGNSTALKVVLDEVRGLGIEHLFALGDFVGYYYHPDEVLQQLRTFETIMIRGNHETMLERAYKNPDELNATRLKYGSGIDEALKKLSSNEVAMLISLPKKRSVSLGGMRFLLCHGSPWDNEEYIYPDASDEKLKACADQDEDFVLMGHTHYPLLRTFGTKTLLNPGSIGQPRDIGSSASWAIIDTDARTVTMRRTPFDGQSVADEAREKDPDNAYLSEVLLRKRS